MAICVSCGLEVVDGILQVNVCDSPVVENVTASGGLRCNTDKEGGCLEVVLNSSHVGCGLKAVGGAVVFDPCLNGGLLCGDTADDPEDGCVYVNVQGQGNAACTPLADAQTACPSPNCNGLVRTCEGLWAPPKLTGEVAQSGAAESAANLGGLIRPLDQPQFVTPSSATDGVLAGANGDIMFWEWTNIGCGVMGAAIHTNINIPAFFVKPGERWRFRLWERLAAGPTPIGPLATPWAFQSEYYLDNTAGNQPIALNAQLFDVSQNNFETPQGQGARGEVMITVNRLAGTGPIDNDFVPGSILVREYRAFAHSVHCSGNDAGIEGGFRDE